MYRLSKLYATNFMSYQELYLEFDGKNFIVIKAEPSDILASEEKSNGFGKSTIAEVISYAIYGKLIRTLGVKVPPDELIKDGEKKLSCGIVLANPDVNESIRIERTLTLDNASTVSLFVNDKKKEYDKKGDLSNAIPEFLGLDFDMLLRRFLSPETTPFLKLKPSARYKVIESFLDFNWNKVYTEAQTKEAKYKKETVSLEREKAKLETEKIQLAGQINSLEMLLDSKRDKLNALTKKKEELIPLFVSIDSRLKEAEKELETKEEEVKTLRNSISMHRGLINHHQSTIMSLKKEKPEDSLTMNLSVLSPLKCPHCEKDIAPDNLVQHFLGAKKREIETAIELSVKEYEHNKQYYDEEVKVAEEKEKDLLKAKKKAQSLSLDRQAKKTELTVIMKEEKELTKEIELANESSSNLGVFKTKLSGVQEKLSVVNDRMMEASIKQKAYGLIKTEAQTSSPARLASVKMILPPLSAGVSKIVSHLFSREIKVSFMIEGEELIISAPGLKLVTVSSGETRSFDIAVAFTLQNIALMSSRNKIGFLIGDEIFDHLDGERIELVVGVIKNLSTPQSILITHSEKGKSLLEVIENATILKVTKENGTSTAKFV